MAQPSKSANPAILVKRIVSSLVLLAVAGLSVWQGGWLFALFLSALTAVMVWEWCRLVGITNQWMVAAFCLITAAMPWLVEEHRVVLSLHGAAVILGASLIYTVERFGKRGWLVGTGPALIAVAMLSGQYLRDLPSWSRPMSAAMSLGKVSVGRAWRQGSARARPGPG
jgi:CDP-diglyceride synthetase